MSKKISFFLVLVFSVMSIMLIAVWGTLPENTNPIQVETIAIINYDEITDLGDKIKDVSEIVTEENSIYIIDYEITPTNAFTNIYATSSSTLITIQVDDLTKKVFVYYDLEAIIKEVTITIKITDKITQIFDEITLIFKIDDIIIVPDI